MDLVVLCCETPPAACTVRPKDLLVCNYRNLAVLQKGKQWQITCYWSFCLPKKPTTFTESLLPRKWLNNTCWEVESNFFALLCLSSVVLLFSLSLSTTFSSAILPCRVEERCRAWAPGPAKSADHKLTAINQIFRNPYDLLEHLFFWK